MYIWADLHTHTRFSHGRGKIEDNVRQACSRGLKALAITDHGPASLGVGMSLTKKLPVARRDVESCRRRYTGVSVLLGIEANIVGLDGTIDVPLPVIETLDILMVGLHPRVFPCNPGSFLYLSVLNPLSRVGLYSKKEIRRVNTRALINAVERYPVDIVSHPGSNLSVDTAALSQACRKRGTLLEINNQHADLTREYIEVAAGAGACFSINSDAHKPGQVGCVGKAQSIAASLGLGHRQIFNAGPHREERLELLQSRRRRGNSDRILPGSIM